MLKHDISLESENKTIFITQDENGARALRSMGYLAVSIENITKINLSYFPSISPLDLVVIIPNRDAQRNKFIAEIWLAIQLLANPPKVIWLDFPTLDRDDNSLVGWINAHLRAAKVFEWKSCPLVPTNNIEQIKRILSLELEYAKTIEDITALSNSGGGKS